MLVYETEEDCKAHLFTEVQLRRQLESEKVELQFVFVASCHSEKTGRQFHKAGAKHVICIRQRE